MTTEPFNRRRDDTSNILLLEHVNLQQPDQALATLFYVVGLQGTRDPYLMVGVDNMWVNFGRTQMHLPTSRSGAQLLRGSMGPRSSSARTMRHCCSVTPCAFRIGLKRPMTLSRACSSSSGRLRWVRPTSAPGSFAPAGRRVR